MEQMNNSRILIQTCNTCGSGKKIFLFTFGDLKLVKCADCSLVYGENPLAPSQAADAYERENYTGEDGSAANSEYVAGEYFRMREDNRKMDHILKIFPGSITTLLDVGCGTGFFVKVAAQRGIKAIGLEISKNAVEQGRLQGLDLRQEDLLELKDFAPESFDVITFWASITNLYYPKETLQKAHTLLKKDGLVVIETGNIGSIHAKLFKEKWRIFLPSLNYYYSSSTLDDVLKIAGFKTIKTEYDGFVESAAKQFNIERFLRGKLKKMSAPAKHNTSLVKELINGIAGTIGLGDVMIKYAKKR